jgi:DNA-binding PadR family transcriptional regulator
MLRYVTLGLLRDGEARHGYALMKAYRELSGIDIGPGSFYRELPRLVAEGLIRPAENPPDADERRVPYVITDEGAARFDAWFSSHPAEPATESYEDELAARVVFFERAAPEAARKIVSQWEDELWMRAKRLERAHGLALTKKDPSAPPTFPVRVLLLQRRLKHAAADLAFLKEVQSLFEEWIGRSAASKASSRKTSAVAPRRSDTDASGGRPRGSSSFRR